MSKKQLLAVGLIAMSLVSSGIIYQRIQTETTDVELAEEPLMEENVVDEAIAQVEALTPKDQNILNALSAIKNLSAQKTQAIGQMEALNSQVNSYKRDINRHLEVLQTWLARQPLK